MTDAATQLEALRQRIADLADEEMPVDYLSRLTVIQTADVFHLDFYGDCFEDSYEDLLTTLARTDLAAGLRSLILRGPDEGANGTKNWDLQPLLNLESAFPELETFAIQLNQPGDHNRSIIGADFEEAGVLAQLLSKSTRLQELTVPSAPDAEFFRVGERPLRSLSVDAGYDTQGFISNLASSSCFPALRNLEWGEYHETCVDDYLSNCTPLEDYRALFQSKAFATVNRFVWRNPVCTDDEIKELKALKPDLQLLVVRFSSDYA